MAHENIANSHEIPRPIRPIVNETASTLVNFQKKCIVHQDKDKIEEAMALSSNEESVKKKHRKEIYLKARRKKHFLKEVIKMNGGKRFDEKKIVVWYGDMVSGVWTTVTQLSPLGEVRDVGEGGNKGNMINGFVGRMPDGGHNAIDQSLIRIQQAQPCMARQGLHKTAKSTIATRLTGECFGGCHVRVRWDTSEEEWLYTHQIENMTTAKRQTKPINRFCPGKKEGGSSTSKAGRVGKKRNTDFDKQYLAAYEQMGEDRNCTISHAIDAAFTNGEGGENGTVTKKRSSKECDDINKELCQLSLTYEVLRGNTGGVISEAFDFALGISRPKDKPKADDGGKGGDEKGIECEPKADEGGKGGDEKGIECDVYMNAIADLVNGKNSETKKRASLSQWHMRKKSCQSPECSRYAHKSIGRGVYCAGHTPKKWRKLCNMCNINLAKRKGGLCQACFKGEAEDERVCTICKVRRSRMANGCCTSCLESLGRRVRRRVYNK